MTARSVVASARRATAVKPTPAEVEARVAQFQGQLARSFHDARERVSTALPGPVGGVVNDALYLVRRLVLPTGEHVGLFGTAECVAAKDCSGKDLTGAQHHDQNLGGVDFTGATGLHANFRNADFTTAATAAGPLPAATTPAEDAAAAEAYLELLGWMGNLSGFNAPNSDLAGATLSGYNMTNINLSGSDLTQANLSNSNLTGARLIGASVGQANLRNANLTGALFYREGFRGINCSGCSILNLADLTNANLTNADIRSTFMASTNLTGANLTGANLTGSNLYEQGYPAILTGATCPNGQLHGSGGDC